MSDDYRVDLLLSRLMSPSGMVRERVCDAASRLLINQELGGATLDALLRWISEQSLESSAATGLLVLIRARATNSKWAPPDAKTVVSAVRRPSLLSNMLMVELYGRSHVEQDLRECHSGTIPADHQPDPFFAKYARGFLPPVYADWADSITRRYRAPFSRQWAYEWQLIVDTAGIRKTGGPLDFRGLQHSDHYIAFDTLMSEAYRSAFLRALAWAAHFDVLDMNDAEYLAIMTCQLDLGLWLIDPVARPPWWPTVAEPDGAIDTVPMQVWQEVEDLWNAQEDVFGDRALIQAGGRVHEGKTVYDLEILGAFQRCVGSTHPDAEEVAEWYLDRSYVPYTPGGMPFGGTVPKLDISSHATALQDWLLLRAAVAVRPMSNPRWEYWKDYRGIWIPLPQEDLDLVCAPDGVLVSEGSAQLAIWQVWTDGLREREPGVLASPATGELLTVDRKKITECQQPG